MADAGVLTHIHIPKTGGTSVRSWLIRAYPRSFWPNIDLDVASAPGTGVANRRVHLVSTHNIRRFPPTYCGRVMRYFTLVRDPVEQYLSYLYYMKQVGATITDPLHREQLPPDLATISSRDFTAWLLDRPLHFRFRDNAQTNFIAEQTWRERANDPAEGEAYRRERLAIAQDVLKDFVMVGTLERLHESLELLRERSAAFGFQLRPAEDVGHDNVTQAPRDDVGWIGDHDDVGRRLLDTMADDRALHAYADALLDEARDRRAVAIQ